LFGAGLSAALVVIASAIMAPSRRTTVAWVAVSIGAAVATWIGYRAGAVAEAAVAVACGVIAAVLVSRHQQSPERKIARANAVPNA
jgi:predicted MFS family arabinose efflux permease